MKGKRMSKKRVLIIDPNFVTEILDAPAAVPVAAVALPTSPKLDAIESNGGPSASTLAPKKANIAPPMDIILKRGGYASANS